MRDDCNVNAFRLHSFWIKLCIVLLIALLGACVAGAYGTLYYHNRYRVSSAERRELQRVLGENKIRLESLSNEELVGRFTGTGSGGAFIGNTVVSPNNGQANGQGPLAQNSGEATTLPTPEDLARLLDQSGPVRTAGTTQESDLEAQMEKHPVKIDNLKVKFEGSDRIRFTYDLSNQQQGLTLVGRCSIGLIMREGALIDLTPSARGVLSFQIARFRKMDVLAQIPANIKREDIIKIQVSAKANDLPLYYRQFPIGE